MDSIRGYHFHSVLLGKAVMDDKRGKSGHYEQGKRKRDAADASCRRQRGFSSVYHGAGEIGVHLVILELAAKFSEEDVCAGDGPLSIPR